MRGYIRVVALTRQTRCEMTIDHDGYSNHGGAPCVMNIAILFTA